MLYRNVPQNGDSLSILGFGEGDSWDQLVAQGVTGFFEKAKAD
ncbi:hypothetical protein SAMN05660330_04306 [Desulforhopalus singaporensis]|uniref:Uncharacterized protein n=1 Tax=Desulforhopalus singaporensis TaxID=91360 RepID=A0A1H0VXU7_9BACT|nr:hypothetical protein SAMN05660330_04306 [Desulforhopalus singaporensis]